MNTRCDYTLLGAALCGVSFLALGFGPAAAAPSKTRVSKAPFSYQNPIHFDKAAGWYTDRLRDPHMIRVGDTFYLVHTMHPCGGDYDPYKRFQNTSPGIRLYSTKDFKNWKAGNWLVSNVALPADSPYKNTFYAPEIHKIHNKFYLIFYAGNTKNEPGGNQFVGVADKVTGPYQNICELKGAWCDATLFEGDDGKIYTVTIGDGLKVSEVDLSGMAHGVAKLVGPQPYALDMTNFDKNVFSDKWSEGPWVRKRNGKYYLFWAMHGANGRYMTAVAYADHPLGPWTRDADPSVFWGGHLAVFDGPDGNWWYSYKNEAYHAVGEDFLCIDPVAFTPDGKIAKSTPTPYNLVTTVSASGKTTRAMAPVKPEPVYPAPPPWPEIVLLPPATDPLPAPRKIADWAFAKNGAGNTPADGAILKGDGAILWDDSGTNAPVRAVVKETGAGPRYVRYAAPAKGGYDGYALNTSEGMIDVIGDRNKPLLNTNKNFSVWTRVMPLQDPGHEDQGIATLLGRWHLVRTSSGRLQASVGDTIRDILGGDGPKLERNQWYDVGLTFSGNGDPEDLHIDTVTVYLNGKAVGTARGRGMFNVVDDVQFGAGWHGVNQLFPALYDRIIFWQGVVGPDEFTALSAGR